MIANLLHLLGSLEVIELQQTKKQHQILVLIFDLKMVMQLFQLFCLIGMMIL